MVINKLDEKIFYYTNVIDNPNSFIKNIEDSNEFCGENKNITKWDIWTASTDLSEIYGLSKNGIFSKTNFNSSTDFELYKIASTIKYVSDFAMSFYCNANQIYYPWLPDFFTIKKYNQGVDMGPHVDSNDPTDFNHPIISGVLYLNDDYDGGEIHFPNQDIQIKPSAGSIIIFPSYEPYLHHPQKILNGNKYMVPLFWYSKAF